MKIDDTLNHVINTSLAKAKNNAMNFNDVLKNTTNKTEKSATPYTAIQNELKQWNKTMLKFELQNELNKMFFANYGIGDKKQNDPFNQMLRIKELAKKLNDL